MTPSDHRPDGRLAFTLAAITLGSVGGLMWWVNRIRHRLPDPVAHHWGASGVADGFSSLAWTMGVTIALTLVVTAPLALIAVLSRQPLVLRRTLGAGAAFLCVFVVAVVADSLRGQLDLVDAAHAPPPGPGIAIGIVGGLLAAVAAAAAATDRAVSRLATAPPPPTAPRLDLPPANPSWEGTTPGWDVAARVIAVIAALALGAMALTVSWWLLAIAVPVTAILIAGSRVRVVIDERGLIATALGLRMVRVPLEEIAEADVAEVNPFWEFGGWGLRVDVAGRTGIITRKGKALRVRRGDGSEVLVTVDDAVDAAATLNSLLDRHHA